MPEINPDEFYVLTEIDCATGAVTKRKMTEEEIADMEQIRLQAESERAVRAAEEAAKLEAKIAAAAKLQALGLTEEEIKALTGN